MPCLGQVRRILNPRYTDLLDDLLGFDGLLGKIRLLLGLTRGLH